MEIVNKWFMGISASLVLGLFGFVVKQETQLAVIQNTVLQLEEKLDKNVYYTEKNYIDERLARKNIALKELEAEVVELRREMWGN